jgi:hypothetical protein
MVSIAGMLAIPDVNSLRLSGRRIAALRVRLLR